MEKLLVHISIYSEFDGGFEEERPIKYASLETAQLDLEIIYLLRSDILKAMSKEIEYLEFELEKNEQRWAKDTRVEKALILRQKEQVKEQQLTFLFGGNKFSMEELGDYDKFTMDWTYRGRINELNLWFDKHFPNLS